MTPYYYSNEKRFYNFREIINDSAVRYAKRTAFQIKTKSGDYKNITYAELKNLYYGLCTKFIKMGYLGKRIAVIGANSFEWALSYLCASTVGVVVPIDKLSILITVIFSYFVFKEKLSKKAMLGLCLMVAGTLLMTFFK